MKKPPSGAATGGERPPWSAFREALAAAGFRPSKSLGQNFLLDSNCARAIAADAQVGPEDFVLEVGPGCGFLSTHLAELEVELLLVEIDPRLARITRSFLGDRPRVRLIEADVLDGKHRIAAEVRAALPESDPWHLVSNLPYSITGPLLVNLARLSNPPQTMTVLVQREVADRLTARPGGKEWGGLTARLSLTYRATKLRNVGAELFWPRPRVESAVARLERVPRPELTAQELAACDRLVDVLFQQRRKTLRAILRRHVAPGPLARAFAEVGVEPSARPEELDESQLLALTRAIGPLGAPG